MRPLSENTATCSGSFLSLGPQGPNVAGQCVPHFIGQSWRNMPAKHRENASRSQSDVHWSNTAKFRGDACEEFVLGADSFDIVTWLKLVVVSSTYQKWQLRTEVCSETWRQPVTQGSQDRTQHMPRDARSGPTASMISSSQMLVVWSVLSNTSRPVVLIVPSNKLGVASKREGSSTVKRARSCVGPR